MKSYLAEAILREIEDDREIAIPEEVVSEIYDMCEYDLEGDNKEISFPGINDIDGYVYDINAKTYQKICDKLRRLINNTTYYYDEDSRDTYIELSGARVLNDINNDSITEEEYNNAINDYINAFEDKYNVELWLLGRNARHVCVNNTYENLLKKDEYKSTVDSMVDELIATFNSISESEDIEERRTKGIDKSIERIKSEIDRVDREHKSCTDEDRGKKLADKMEDLVTRLNKLEAYKEIKESDDIDGALADDIKKVANIEPSSDEDSTLDNINEPRYGVIYDCIFRSGDIMARQYQIQSPEGFSLLLKLDDNELGTWIDVNRVEPDDWTWEFNQYIFSNDSVEDEEAKERQHLIEEKYGEDVLQIIYDFARYFKLDKDDLDESSLEEDMNKVVIRNYADSDGEIDLDVTDNEIDILVAFSFDFSDSDDSYYSQFMNILANNVEVISFSGGILNCKFSDYFKKYNDELADLFESDDEEAYIKAVVDLELLLPGFAKEEIYKKLVDILKGINELSDRYEQKRISDDEAYDRYKRNHPEELNYDLYSQPMEVIDEINSGIYGMTWDEILNDYEENPESDAYIDIIREAKKSLWLKNHINK